jgi:hypothetical protein
MEFGQKTRFLRSLYEPLPAQYKVGDKGLT